LVENFDHYLDEESIVGIANESWERLTKNVIAEMQAGGYRDSNVVLKKFAALKYAGQSTELIIPIPWRTLKEDHIPDLAERFHAEHLKTYAHKHLGEPVAFVNLGVAAQLPPQDVLPQGGERMAAEPVDSGKRRAYFGKDYGWINTPLLDERAIPKVAQKGPAIIELYDSTLVVPPYCKFVSGPSGTVLIDLES
jgi:N-methylhydantoinase A